MKTHRSLIKMFCYPIVAFVSSASCLFIFLPVFFLDDALAGKGTTTDVGIWVPVTGGFILDAALTVTASGFVTALLYLLISDLRQKSVGLTNGE